VIRGLALLAGLVCVSAGCAGEPSDTGRTTAAGDRGGERVAPYVDVTRDDVPDLAAVARDGVGIVNLAFVIAGEGCEPAWGGVLPHDDAGVAARIRAVREAGGDVRVSFGGASPTELAQRCGDVPALVAAYRTVVDGLDVVHVDFDVEGATLADVASVRRRNAAVARLQAERELRVTYTLPVDDEGLTAQARALLRDARAAGVRVDAVNVMTMNYGTGPADLAARAMSVATATRAFVQELWPGTPEADAWRMVAVTPMLGVNDVEDEIFEPADARRLVAFAREHGLGWLSFWSMNRDRPCRDGPVSGARDDCSGVPQSPGEFTEIFTAYARSPT
jgi:hypothetical protein